MALISGAAAGHIHRCRAGKLSQRLKVDGARARRRLLLGTVRGRRERLKTGNRSRVAL
jgi:hypothetical protein